MSKTKYAFPHNVGDYHEPNTAGMTLRDYFAAKAMQAGYDKHYDMFMDNTYEDWHGDGIEGLAQEAYIIADEMLKARDK